MDFYVNNIKITSIICCAGFTEEENSVSSPSVLEEWLIFNRQKTKTEREDSHALRDNTALLSWKILQPVRESYEQEGQTTKKKKKKKKRVEIRIIQKMDGFYGNERSRRNRVSICRRFSFCLSERTSHFPVWDGAVLFRLKSIQDDVHIENCPNYTNYVH